VADGIWLTGGQPPGSALMSFRVIPASADCVPPPRQLRWLGTSVDGGRALLPLPTASNTLIYPPVTPGVLAGKVVRDGTQ
jgi:hypothetical protein